MADEVVNLEGLLEIAGDDQEFVRDVIAQYSERGAKLVLAIQHASSLGEEDDLAAYAHALKGSSRAVGALRLGSACEIIELAARECRVDSALHVIQDLPSLWAVTSAQLQEAV